MRRPRIKLENYGTILIIFNCYNYAGNKKRQKQRRI